MSSNIQLRGQILPVPVVVHHVVGVDEVDQAPVEYRPQGDADEKDPHESAYDHRLRASEVYFVPVRVWSCYKHPINASV